MWAPSRVVAMEPVGITKASTTKARKMKARMKAMRMDSMVSLTELSARPGGGVAAPEVPPAAGVGVWVVPAAAGGAAAPAGGFFSAAARTRPLLSEPARLVA